MTMSGFDTTTFIERWHELTLMEQLGNIGSEVERVISWRNRGNSELSAKALDRTLQLLTLTIGDTRWHDAKLGELTRIREIICDAFVGDNVYNTSDEYLSKYFLAFAVAARRRNGK